MLTIRQRAALDDPLVEERVIDYPLARRIDRPEGRYGTLLTVDRGLNYESDGPWYWHASVSALGDNWKPLPFATAPEQRRAAAREIAEGLLVGVGAGESEWAEGEKAVHVRRALTAEEIAQLPTDRARRRNI